MNRSILKVLISFAAISYALTHAGEAVAVERKAVQGRLVLCEIRKDLASSETSCTNPITIPDGIIGVRRIGGSKTSNIVADGQGRFTVLLAPGMYELSSDLKQPPTVGLEGCALDVFPRTKPKILIVGPKNKRKDLYFSLRCS